MVFVVQYFIFLRPATQSFGIHRKMLSILCPFVVLTDLPCFSTSLVCHAAGPPHFQGLCLQGYNCSRIQEPSVSGCLRQWLLVPSDSDTQFFLTIIPCALIIQHGGISPAHAIGVFLFSSRHDVLTLKKSTSEKEFVPLLFRIVVIIILMKTKLITRQG